MATRTHRTGALDELGRLNVDRPACLLGADPPTLVDVPVVRRLEVAPVTAEVPLRRQLTSPSVRPQAPPRRSRAAPRSPLLVRMLVVALAVVFSGGLAALAVQAEHPEWLAFARNVSDPQVTHLVSRPIASRHVAAPLFREVQSGPKRALYRVAARRYTIVFEVDQPVWVVLESPAGHVPPVLARTLRPGGQPTSVTVAGSASAVVSARTAAIVVREGSRVLGTIEAPRLGTTYTFAPDSGKGSPRRRAL